MIRISSRQHSCCPATIAQSADRRETDAACVRAASIAAHHRLPKFEQRLVAVPNRLRFWWIEEWKLIDLTQSMGFQPQDDIGQIRAQISGGVNRSRRS